MLLKSACFPFNPEITCEQLLSLIEQLRVSMVRVYEAAGKRYIQILRWKERPRSPSKFPEPPSCEQLLADDSKCLAPSPSPSPSPIVAASVPNGTGVSLTSDSKKIRLASKEDIAELEKDPSLKGLNLHQEYAAMVRWCDSHRKKPTLRRFTNWINLSASKLKYKDTSRPRIGPTLAEVQAYAKEKWFEDHRHVVWATSFYGHWSNEKRQWKRGGAAIDWKSEITKQVAIWRGQ